MYLNEHERKPKMNALKKILSVFLFLYFCQTSFADCGHCFSIIKVKIIYNNGNTEISNLKFFRQYVLDNNEIRPNENEPIKKYFPQNKDTIQLIDSIYQLKNLAAFINKENIRDIALKEIKNIYLLEWTTIQGAGELPYLSSESIERIINSDTLFINSKLFSVYDEQYIYTGTKLSLEDFNVLIEKSNNYDDVEPSIIRRLKINRRKNIYPDKVELNKAFKYYFKEINKSICSTSEIKINKEIDEYFQIYSTNLKKKKRYLELVLEYLNTTVSNNLENFISVNVKGDYQKNSLIKEICKERDIIKTTIALVRKLYIFKEDHILNEEFYKVLKKENIIILIVGWD
jgi:hypothetical protein